MLHRRQFLSAAAGLAALPTAAWAQAYPARPVTLMVSVGAGGAPDIIARLIGQWLSQRLGQPVVIENRPGGGGNVAMQAVVRAPADGHTLLLVMTPHAINTTLYEHQNIDVLREIAPIAGLTRDSFVLVVNPALPVATVGEFIAHAKANPGKINITSSGTGNLGHLSGELFRMMTGIEMVHVPFRGAAPAITALVAGDVHAMFDAIPSALPHIQAGRLRALAVTAATRSPTLADVPTVADTVPGYDVTGWLGVGAPKSTPADVIEKLNAEINAGLTDPGIRAQLTNKGSLVLAGAPDEFSAHIAAEIKKWAVVVRFAGIKPN